MENPFKHLRHEEYPDAAPVADYDTRHISTDAEEDVRILTAEAEPGRWVAGYSVYWKNGRHSFLAPSLSNGWFSSKREAILFYLGFMSAYMSYFTPQTRCDIKAEIGNFQQSTLF